MLISLYSFLCGKIFDKSLSAAERNYKICYNRVAKEVKRKSSYRGDIFYFTRCYDLYGAESDILSGCHYHPYMSPRFALCSSWPFVTEYLLSHTASDGNLAAAGKIQCCEDMDNAEISKGLREDGRYSIFRKYPYYKWEWFRLFEATDDHEACILLLGDYLITDAPMWLAEAAKRDSFYAGLLNAYKKDWENLYDVYSKEEDDKNMECRAFLDFICVHTKDEYRAFRARVFPTGSGESTGSAGTTGNGGNSDVDGLLARIADLEERNKELLARLDAEGEDVAGKLSLRGQLALMSIILGDYYYQTSDCDFQKTLGPSYSAIPSMLVTCFGTSNGVYKYPPFGQRSDTNGENKPLSASDKEIIQKTLDSLRIDVPVGLPADILAYFRKKREADR